LVLVEGRDAPNYDNGGSGVALAVWHRRK